MGLGSRAASLHDTVSVRKHALDHSVYYVFKEGQRVLTVDGVPGIVTAVYDGPTPGNEDYEVRLDNNVGGGHYTAGQLTAVGPAPVTALDRLASDDYPELGTILYDRPPIEREGARHTAAKPRRSKNFPYGKRHGIEITDPPYPAESGIVQCDNCGKYHSATYDHEGMYNEGPVHAVTCPQDELTDYYTNERLEPREAVAGRSNEDEPQDPTSLTDPFSWAPDEETFADPDLSRQLPADGQQKLPVQMPAYVDPEWRQ